MPRLKSRLQVSATSLGHERSEKIPSGEEKIQKALIKGPLHFGIMTADLIVFRRRCGHSRKGRRSDNRVENHRDHPKR